MNKSEHGQALSRRKFLRGASLVGLGGTVSAFSAGVAGAAAPKASRAADPRSGYDLERFRKTDPALILYEAVARFRSPYPEPKRLAFAPNGTLWLTAGERVVALDSQGGKTIDWAVGEEVRCLALGPEGRVLVGLKDHLELCDASGKKVARWDSPAKRAWLTSVAAGPQDVFVSDAGNRVVHRLGWDGKVRGRLGEKDAARDIPAFLVPSPYFDLEVGADGLLWVVNPGLHQFQAFTFDGQLEKRWGEASFGIAGFCGCCNPSYFTRLADGCFVTSEKGLARVKVYSAEGKFQCVVAGAEEFPRYYENVNATPVPMDVAAAADGRVYVADTLGHEIRVYRRKEKV